MANLNIKVSVFFTHPVYIQIVLTNTKMYTFFGQNIVMTTFPLHYLQIVIVILYKK